MNSGTMTERMADSVDALIAGYVTGALPAPLRVLVGAHLELKPQAHAFAAGLEALAGDAMAAGAGIGIGGRDARLDAVFASAPPADPTPAFTVEGQFPAALRQHAGFDARDVPWRSRMPGFRTHDFGEQDGCEMSLFWIRPGRPIPSHTHEGSEVTLVLDGAFVDASGRYGRGDIAIADETVDHRPVAENGRPCVCLAVTDAPLRFTGPLRRRLGDILFG